MELIEIFETLVKIPSPSLKEDKVADKIMDMMKENNINARRDKTGNVYIKIEGNDKTKKPLCFSSHMDVVGDDSPVNLIYNGNFIETDKKRTLGADDKAGVAAGLKLALEMKNFEFSHGGIEIILTRDEEQSMTGISGVEFDKIEGADILVMDSDKLGNFEISGAGYTKLTLGVKTLRGGHSGIDIGDKTRLNAAKLTAEIVNEIPQGVFKENEFGTVTSINLGSIVAGAVDNSIYRAVEENVEKQDGAKFVCFNSMSNLINTKGYAHYSLRSSDKKYENELIAKIQGIVDGFNKKYENLAEFSIEIEERMPIFEKPDNDDIIEIAQNAGKKTGIDVKVQSFHAGAETHIYANKTNKFGEKFRPVLVGVADIFNMHSPDEKIDVETFKKGYELIKEIFREYNQ